MKKLFFILLFLVICVCSFGQNTSSTITNTIHFTADISGILGLGIGGAFNPDQDSLLVMGFDWDDSTTIITGNRMMENTDPFNPGIYTTTLTVQSSSDSLRWKFKAFPDSRFQNNGWEYNQDRWFVFDSSNSTVILPDIVPDIRPNWPILPSDVDLQITVDMTFAHNKYNGMPIPLEELEFVGIRGTVDFLGSLEGGCWCPDDTLTGLMKVFTHFNGNMWRYRTIIPAGTVSGAAEYRFGAMYPDADTLNGGLFPLDNEVPPHLNHFFIIFASQTTITLWNYFGYFDSVEKLEDLIPTSINLEQNYPNPFNPTTKIRYSIPEYSSVSLKVFNLLGEEIETLFNGEQSAGVYEATFDASQLTSGVYFYTLKTDNFISSKKMILVR